MSLIVTVYVNEGIVMASDSRTTLTVDTPTLNGIERRSFPLSDTTHKTFLCPNNCGISTCGDAGYNGQAIAYHMENFINNKVNKDTKVSDIPEMLKNYFNNIDAFRESIFHVCGYEEIENKIHQKFYRVVSGKNSSITDVNPNQVQGAIWDGEITVISKLMKSQILVQDFLDIPNFTLTLDNGTQQYFNQALIMDKSNTLYIPEAPIAWQYLSLQDAVDFAKFAIETTVNAMKFQAVNKTVEGAIDILIIKPSRAKWLKHKKLSA